MTEIWYELLLEFANVWALIVGKAEIYSKCALLVLVDSVPRYMYIVTNRCFMYCYQSDGITRERDSQTSVNMCRPNILRPIISRSADVLSYNYVAACVM